MPAEARQAFADRLYHIHSRIFSGVNKARFIRYVVEPPTRITRIYLLQNNGGEDVGYLTFQQFEVETRSGKGHVYRTEVGLLPAYRGNNTTLRVLGWEITKAYVRAGFRRSWFLATPIHPNPYCVIYNQGLQVYPNPLRETPAHVLNIMDQLSAVLNISGTGTGLPFQKQVGWIVQYSPDSLRRVRNRTDIASRFFLSQNPDFHQGHGMITLVPVNPVQGLRLIGNACRRLFRKRSGVERRRPQAARVSRKGAL